MILHLLRLRRNVNRNVFNDRKNVSETTDGQSTRHVKPATPLRFLSVGVFGRVPQNV